MYMPKKIRMQHLLHIHEIFLLKQHRKNRSKKNRSKSLLNLYLIVKIKFTLCEYNTQQ